MEIKFPSQLIQICLILGSDSQLVHCFMQITSNAQDALVEAGGGTFLHAYKNAHEVVIEFSDTGAGMSEPDRVFDPTHQSGRRKGAGLG
jgi:signal transduction histidine kinase